MKCPASAQPQQPEVIVSGLFCYCRFWCGTMPPLSGEYTFGEI